MLKKILAAVTEEVMEMIFFIVSALFLILIVVFGFLGNIALGFGIGFSLIALVAAAFCILMAAEKFVIIQERRKHRR